MQGAWPCQVEIAIAGRTHELGCAPPQVNIHVPAPELQSDSVAITGLAAHLDRAKAGLLERVKELQAEQEDRVRAAPCGIGQAGWSDTSTPGP